MRIGIWGTVVFAVVFVGEVKGREVRVEEREGRVGVGWGKEEGVEGGDCEGEG